MSIVATNDGQMLQKDIGSSNNYCFQYDILQHSIQQSQIKLKTFLITHQHRPYLKIKNHITVKMTRCTKSVLWLQWYYLES